MNKTDIIKYPFIKISNKERTNAKLSMLENINHY